MLIRSTAAALADLDEALKVAPAGRDIRRILLKAKEETEAACRLQSHQSSCNNNKMMETSTDTILDCNSSGIGSSLGSSERG